MVADHRAILYTFRNRASSPRDSRRLSTNSGFSSDSDPDILEAPSRMLSGTGLSNDLLESWNFIPLALDRERCHTAAVFFLSPRFHGMPVQTDATWKFVQSVEAGYLNVTYHSWFHGVDTAHATYRLLGILSTELYLRRVERLALLVSAVAHDMGHPGVTNQFLIESSHELAIRYNDQSPLENLHCSKLFAVLSVPQSNVFALLSSQEYADARRVCVQAIIHTDMAHHFGITKELKLLGEYHDEIFGEGRKFFQTGSTKFPSKKTLDIFCVKETRALVCTLLLHLADLWNPMKPFKVCYVWASRCIEEMFLLGEKAKALGMPVHPLHDRRTVNKAFSQLGFMEFLVAPLLLPTVKVFAPVGHYADQLIENMKGWRELWETETHPHPSDE